MELNISKKNELTDHNSDEAFSDDLIKFCESYEKDSHWLSDNEREALVASLMEERKQVRIDMTFLSCDLKKFCKKYGIDQVPVNCECGEKGIATRPFLTKKYAGLAMPSCKCKGKTFGFVYIEHKCPSY